MSSGVMLVSMVALLCAAGGLLALRHAALARERALAEHFAEKQLQPSARAAANGVKAANAANTASAVNAAAHAARRGAPAQPGPGANAAARVRYAHARATYAFDNLMSRAGIANPRAFVGVSVAVTLLAAIWTARQTAPVAALGTCCVAAFGVLGVLSWRAQKRYQRIARQLPLFLDGIVRLVTIGNSVPAAFQAALATTDGPLRECLDRVSALLRTGVEIDSALHHVAEVYRVRELELVGTVLRVSVKYGGRSDVMLDRMAALMRDLEQADRELIALSTETRLSSWVLGLLPVLLGGFVIVSNPRYFAAMWDVALGRRLVFTAFALQAAGMFLLYRLARLRH